MLVFQIFFRLFFYEQPSIFLMKDDGQSPFPTE